MAFCVLSRNKKTICRIFFGFEFISFPNRGVLAAAPCIFQLVGLQNIKGSHLVGHTEMLATVTWLLFHSLMIETFETLSSINLLP